MMNLDWNKCYGDVWCKLNAVNLDHQHFNNREGIYLIWHGGTDPAVVYVGQGVIRDRLRAHRKDSDIQQFARFDLFVTWAYAEEQSRNGIEAFLANRWRPKVGSEHPDANFVEVNSPW